MSVELKDCVDHGQKGDKDGYGKKRLPKGWYGDSSQLWLRFHRFAYEVHYGVDIRGGVIMHLCDNPRCINPEHLKLGTQGENLKMSYDRGRSKLKGVAVLAAAKTHCKYGHEFTDDNTYVRFQAGRPTRECRKCRSLRNALRSIKSRNNE